MDEEYEDKRKRLLDVGVKVVPVDMPNGERSTSTIDSKLVEYCKYGGRFDKSVETDFIIRFTARSSSTGYPPVHSLRAWNPFSHG